MGLLTRSAPSRIISPGQALEFLEDEIVGRGFPKYASTASPTLFHHGTWFPVNFELPSHPLKCSLMDVSIPSGRGCTAALVLAGVGVLDEVRCQKAPLPTVLWDPSMAFRGLGGICGSVCGWGSA